MKLFLAMRLALGAAIGIVAGVGCYTFVYAKGGSYFTSSPAACANCHVMQEYYDGWVKSTHRSVAVCNDCHTPAGFVAKYATKASNGFWHSFAFTSGRFPEPLQITARNRRIAQNACDKCHADLVADISGPHRGVELHCARCHGGVGHMR